MVSKFVKAWIKVEKGLQLREPMNSSVTINKEDYLSQLASAFTEEWTSDSSSKKRFNFLSSKCSYQLEDESDRDKDKCDTYKT